MFSVATAAAGITSSVFTDFW